MFNEDSQNEAEDNKNCLVDRGTKQRQQWEETGKPLHLFRKFIPIDLLLPLQKYSINTVGYTHLKDGTFKHALQLLLASKCVRNLDCCSIMAALSRCNDHILISVVTHTQNFYYYTAIIGSKPIYTNYVTIFVILFKFYC